MGRPKKKEQPKKKIELKPTTPSPVLSFNVADKKPIGFIKSIKA